MSSADLENIRGGRPLRNQGRVLDVAAPSMVVGAQCSATEPCWVMAQTSVHVTASDGTTLRSVGARDLLTYLARGKSMALPRAAHLIKEELIEVLWAVDPTSFFFAYVRSSDHKLVAVPVPATASTRGSQCSGKLVHVYVRSSLRKRYSPLSLYASVATLYGQ